ncbi:MAG: hypothetical protein NUV98_01700 [Candidatus Roizmanbacteria bacterium]|nr:hypothetical protein [Candidatus Roizmanbacteria bacterium]
MNGELEKGPFLYAGTSQEADKPPQFCMGWRTRIADEAHGDLVSSFYIGTIQAIPECNVIHKATTGGIVFEVSGGFPAINGDDTVLKQVHQLYDQTAPIKETLQITAGEFSQYLVNLFYLLMQ